MFGYKTAEKPLTSKRAALNHGFAMGGDFFLFYLFVKTLEVKAIEQQMLLLWSAILQCWLESNSILVLTPQFALEANAY